MYLKRDNIHLKLKGLSKLQNKISWSGQPTTVSDQNLIFETPSKLKKTLVVSFAICWNNISHNANDCYEAFSGVQTKEWPQIISKQIWPEDVCSKHADVWRQ